MGFDRWNQAVVASLCNPMTQMCESHALINQANVTVLQLDGRFSEQVKELHSVLHEQYTTLVLKEGINTSVDRVHPNAQAIANSGRRWLSNNLDDNMRCDILIQRVALDPLDQQGMPLTLSLRLFDNGISHLNYAQALQRPSFDNGIDFCLGRPWHLPIIEAIAVIKKSLSPAPKKRFYRLVQQGRLLLTSNAAIGNFCVTSSAGAFIQLNAKQGVVDVLALSHEVGHALDFETRWQQGHYNPPDVVKSEAAAITMEFHVLNKSLNSYHYGHDLKHKRSLFYGAWHQALHQFELGLYTMTPINPENLDKLWEESTHQFGINRVSWRDIQHFYTSPFYLICYPLALSKTGAVDMSVWVSSGCKQLYNGSSKFNA